MRRLVKVGGLTCIIVNLIEFRILIKTQAATIHTPLMWKKEKTVSLTLDEDATGSIEFMMV